MDDIAKARPLAPNMPALEGGASFRAPPDRLWEKAKEFEACVLAEMLVHAGLAKQEGPFSGGIGEGQFASFLAREQARLLVDSGGIGLAARLYRAMGGEGHG